MMRKVIVLIILIILPVLGVRMLWNSFSNARFDIWKQTPAWELAKAVADQDTWKIGRIAKAHPDLLESRAPRSGNTLLIWAVAMEKYRSADALLKGGADPNVASTLTGSTPLFVASGFSWVDRQAKTDPKYVKLLLKYGADPNINYHSGYKHDIIESGTSPLIRSIGCGIEKTRALVEGGTDINHKTASGNTAAISALMEYDNIDYAYYLIVEKKAQVLAMYYESEQTVMSGAMPKQFYPVDILEYYHPETNTKTYQKKMAIIQEFVRQGVTVPSEYYK